MGVGAGLYMYDVVVNKVHVVALILRYFTEFVYDVVVKQVSRFQNLLCIVFDHINTICTFIERLFGQNKL